MKEFVYFKYMQIINYDKKMFKVVLNRVDNIVHKVVKEIKRFNINY